MNMNDRPLIAPSILSADFTDIKGALELIETSGGDIVHLDVMDGHFVPPVTFGEKMVSDIKKRSSLPLDVHLMIDNAEDKAAGYIDAGADWVTVHAEGALHLHRLLSLIKEKGAKAGVSVVPSTPVSLLEEILPLADLVLVMLVNPGFGGQKLIPSCLNKISWLAEYRKAHGLGYLISADGGINADTFKSVYDAQNDVFVAGSAFFGATQPDEFIRQLKSIPAGG